MGRVLLALGALAGALAVVMAALAAHGPVAALPADRIGAVRAAVQIQGWHALALVGLGVLARREPSRWIGAAGAAFALGTVLFAGSVHLGAIWEIGLGPVAPLGGMTLILGWALLAIGALRLPRA